MYDVSINYLKHEANSNYTSKLQSETNASVRKSVDQELSFLIRLNTIGGATYKAVRLERVNNRFIWNRYMSRIFLKGKLLFIIFEK